MTAIKTANIIEGNLATEPKYFPKGQYVARLVFRIMHTDRKLNQQTGQWEDGRTTAVDVTSTARPRNVTRRPSSSSPTCSPREPPWSHGASCPTVPTYGLTATAPHSPRPSSTHAHHPQPARQPASCQSPAIQFHQPAAIHQRGPGTGPVGGTTGTGLNHHERQPGAVQP